MRGILLYTLSRVGLFLVVFLPLQLFTPLRGLFAALIAIAASGLISIFLLNRQRDAASGGIHSVFSRINQRIDSSRSAEDFDDEPYDDETPPSDSPTASNTP